MAASAIDLPPMADGHYQNHESIVLRGGNDPVIADTVAPEPLAVGAQRMAEAARVLAARDGLAQIAQHVPLAIDAELTQLADRGAMQLDPALVKGRRLLNLDTEELNAIYIGCSGGGNGELKIPVAREEAPSGARFFDVRVTGLRGGHSGMDIVLQRGNAIQVLARCLGGAPASAISSRAIPSRSRSSSRPGPRADGTLAASGAAVKHRSER